MKHVTRKHHQEMARACTSSLSLVSFSTPQQGAIEAEARWSIFTDKHNIAFLASDLATKLFCKMFPDSKITTKFACGRTKTTAIEKALAHHFLKKTVGNMYYPFTLLINESNDKTDKSCIILTKVFDPALCDVCTRLLDVPMVNITGTEYF